MRAVFALRELVREGEGGGGGFEGVYAGRAKLLEVCVKLFSVEDLNGELLMFPEGAEQNVQKLRGCASRAREKHRR